MIDQFLMV